MSVKDLAAYLEFAKGLAAEAGVIMRQYFQAENIGTEWKEDNSPVTVADKKINELVIQRVKEVYPEHGIIGEEDSYETKRDYAWVVDPIDGTIPFSLGIPVSTFCLALSHKGELLVSVVYEPMQDRLFSATKGSGAYMNDQKLHVSDTTSFKNSYVHLSTRRFEGGKDLRDIAADIQEWGARNLAVPSFAYMTSLVATGQMLVSMLPYGSQWDPAAIALIVMEAGGRVTDLNGKPRNFHEWGDGILISNGAVHDELVEMTKHADTWN